MLAKGYNYGYNAGAGVSSAVLIVPRSLVRFQPEPGFFPNSDGIGQYMWPRFLSAVIKN